MHNKRQLQRLLSLWILLSFLTEAETGTNLRPEISRIKVRKCCKTNQMIGQFRDCIQQANLGEYSQTPAMFCQTGKISGCQKVLVWESNYFSRCRNWKKQAGKVVKEFLATGNVTGEMVP